MLEVPTEGPNLRLVTIAPRETDPRADNPSDPHIVALDRSVSPREELFVFLTGTGITPDDSRLIISQAAANGFHAIGLSYPNTVAVRELCETDPDDGCYEKARMEIFDGQDRTPRLTITEANSVQSRLAKLLNNLGMRFPGEGWPAYLDGGAPKWSAIRLGGHADGGSLAALVARDHEVNRLCLLEAPPDLIGPPGSGRRLPPWIGPVRATPAERYYNFRHIRSSSPNAEAFALAWTAFGLDQFGPAVDIDSTDPPYGGSHHLTSDAEPVNDGAPNLTHRSVAADGATPRTAGEPTFAPVWQYACFS